MDKTPVLLGKMPDTQVAARLGIHRRYVMFKRRELGIPNYTRAQTESRWTGEIKRLFGKVPDREIAEQLGVSVGTVAAYRLRHEQRAGTYKPTQQIQWTAKLCKQLGKVPDAELADRLGISKSAVTSKRLRLKISAENSRSGNQRKTDQ